MPRRSVRRYSAKRRTRRGVNRRWIKYTFTRMMDLEYKNIDPGALSDPSISVTSYSCPLPVLGNAITPAALDVTAPVAEGCTNFSAAMMFQLANLPNMQEFIQGGPAPAGLFEEYKIKGIQLEFVPTYAGKDLVAPVAFKSDVADDDGYEVRRSYPTPTMYFVHDHDSVNQLNWPLICEMGGVRKIKMDRRRTFYFRPNVVAPVGGSLSGGSVWGTKKTSPWITNRDLTVKHYGFRFYMQDWPGPSDGVGIGEGKTESAVPFSLRVNIRYFFQVRGTV